MKYLVLEIQTNSNGTVGNLVTAYDTRNEAESAYHTVLAAAALSSIPCHAAVLMTSEGFTLEYRKYENAAPAEAE